MIRTLVLTIAIVCQTSPALAADGCEACSLVPDILSALHKLDWAKATPAEVVAAVPVNLSRREALYPSDSPYRTDCSGSLYLLADRDEWHLSIEFERMLTGGACVDVLNSAAFETNTSIALATQIQGRVVVALKAAGALTSPEATEYQWRSTDSRTRFELFTSVLTKARKPHPDTRATLKLILRHDQVVPSEVDELPFEKGFMCSPPDHRP